MDEATQVSVLGGVEEGMPYGGEGVEVIGTIARIECRGERPCSPFLEEGTLALGINDTLGGRGRRNRRQRYSVRRFLQRRRADALTDIFDEGLVSSRDDSRGEGELAEEKRGVSGEGDAADDRVKGLTGEPAEELGAVHKALSEGCGACHSRFGQGSHLLRAT